VALALYRKYRSATFSEVIGQEHVTAPLMQALSAGRINHAYLFSGPRGCGKTSSARILARSLNCEKGPTPTPCGECGSCRDLAPNGPGSIDVIEIDAASHGGVDDARELRERAYYAPVRDRYKVYIIDEAHMVTTQGFNALLKLVEEPPDFLIFIFATTEPDKVLQTIRSRTHHYPFRLIPPSALRAHLERICAAEGATVEPTVFPLVVRSGGGSARDSLSILDQLLAGAGPEGVTYSMAVGLLGVTDSALLDDMIDSLAVGDSAGVYATIDRVVEAGHDPRRFAADLLERFRDLMMIDAMPDAVEKGLIDYPADQADRMADQSRRIGTASLVRFAEITHATLTDMRGTTSPRLMLELLSARMLLPDASADATAVLQRIERLERRQGMGSAEVPVPAPAAVPAPASVPVPAPIPEAVVEPEPTPEPAPPEPAPAADATPAAAATPAPEAAAATEASPEPPVTVAQGGADSAGLRRVWPDVLEQVKTRSRRTRALLDNASVASVEGTAIRLVASSAPIAKMIGDESNLSVLRDALAAVVGGGWQIEVGTDSAPAPSGRAAASADSARPAEPPPAPARRDDSDGVDEESDVVEGSERNGADPEAAAIALLQNSLGARPIDG
jgi:DNA polymerase-3 subunit gamma/tau